MRYLSKEFIIAEVFTIKGAGKRVTEKIGEAKLPLSVLLEGDTSFQAQEIRHMLPDGRNVHIGKLFYRTRMRKPLAEAMKWLHMRSEVTDK